MLKCVICGEDLGNKTGYVRGSISGEVYQYERAGPKATGQKSTWEGVAFCSKHFEQIPKHIEENMQARASKLKGTGEPDDH
jgi:hypothetical protein